MKELNRISTFKLQSNFLRSALLLAGLSALLTGCGNFAAYNSSEVDIPSFRNYMPNVTQEVSIGEAVLFTDLEITVTGVRSSDGRDNRKVRQVPPEGQRFVLVSVLLANQGDKQEDVSPRMSFSLFNSMGQPQEWAYYPAVAGSINGRIDPGAEMMGELTWMVAENAEGLVMIYRDVAFSLGEASGYLPGSPG